MNAVKCPGCGRSIQPEETSCSGCGRNFKRTKGKPLTLQFIVESEKISSFNSFINALSEYVRKNYDINDFSYGMTNVLDEEGKNAGYTRVLMHVTEDNDIMEFIGDWVDNKLGDLDLYNMSKLYKEKYTSFTERHVCPECKGTGKLMKEQSKERCSCQNGYIYTKNICSSCKGRGGYLLGIIKCTACGGNGVLITKRKCLTCGGSGYSRQDGYVQTLCASCNGTGYLD